MRHFLIITIKIILTKLNFYFLYYKFSIVKFLRYLLQHSISAHEKYILIQLFVQNDLSCQWQSLHRIHCHCLAVLAYLEIRIGSFLQLYHKIILWKQISIQLSRFILVDNNQPYIHIISRLLHQILNSPEIINTVTFCHDVNHLSLKIFQLFLEQIMTRSNIWVYVNILLLL